MSLKIALKDIPENGAAFSISDDSWFPDQEISRIGPAAAEFRICRHGRRFRCTGRIEVVISFSCDRCLEDFDAPVVTDFDLLLEPEELADEAGYAHGGEEGDMEILPVAGLVFDAADFLAQQIFLALPVKTLCHDGCRGLCSVCGGNLNVARCQCSGENASPFGGLKKLLQG